MLRHVLFACPGRSCDEYFVIFYIYNGFIPIYDLNFIGTEEFPETIVGGLAGAAGGGDQPGQVLPDKGNRVEHDAVENRDGRGDGGAELHIFHIIRGGIRRVNSGSCLKPPGGNFHGGNVPVIGGTWRDRAGRPGIFFQVGRKIRIVFIVLGGDVHRDASQVETKFHKRYFGEVGGGWGGWGGWGPLSHLR